LFFFLFCGLSLIAHHREQKSIATLDIAKKKLHPSFIELIAVPRLIISFTLIQQTRKDIEMQKLASGKLIEYLGQLLV
jgi:hypothetical protein